MILHHAQKWRDICPKVKSLSDWRPDQRVHAGALARSRSDRRAACVARQSEGQRRKAFELVGITVALERLPEFSEHMAEMGSAH
jgi:hypothetical protein